VQKEILSWTVTDLAIHYITIDFPEYQREPNVWSKAAKQRLVDSMLRQFDIASIYLYKTTDGSLDCIDGRQRIGAIMAFIGKNEEDGDKNFQLRSSNEIYTDDDFTFSSFDGLTFQEVLSKSQDNDTEAKKLIDQFCDYKLTIVQLSESKRPEEFNLQFTRLNLGTAVNAGEKLHAMVGALRDEIFKKGQMGDHPFLTGISIPTRRYSKEQVAAQIVAQIFSLKADNEYTRTRHFDLQRFFKENATLTEDKQIWIQEIKTTLDLLAAGFKDSSDLRNRAITVSTVLLAWKLGLSQVTEAETIASFTREFICRLKWQTEKGFEGDSEYRYLIDFQRHVTQASVERPAVAARAAALEQEYANWIKTGKLSGDSDYTLRTQRDPAKDCRAKK
jgi:hypothetical protein